LTGDEQGINRFSHFEEFMKKKPLRDKRDSDPEFMNKYHNWVYEDKFKDAKDVRLLPKILENEKALDAFENKGYLEAQREIFSQNPSLSSNLYSALDIASSELETISIQEIDSLKNGDEAKKLKINRLKQAIEKIEIFSGISF